MIENHAGRLGERLAIEAAGQLAAKVPAQDSVCGDERDQLGHDHSCRERSEGLAEGVREEEVGEIADGEQQRPHVGHEGAKQDVRRCRDLEPLYQGQHNGREHHSSGVERQDCRDDRSGYESVPVKRMRVSIRHARASNCGPIEKAALADEQGQRKKREKKEKGVFSGKDRADRLARRNQAQNKHRRCREHRPPGLVPSPRAHHDQHQHRHEDSQCDHNARCACHASSIRVL